MSFETELLAALGTADDAWDIRAVVRRCWFFDFDGFPLRVWHGTGVLHAGGQDWLGTIDADGVNRLTVPAVQDARDGASPRYSFGVPHIDAATWSALKDDQDLARNRPVTCYHVICLPGEGMRPGTALRFSYRLKMRGVEFSDVIEGEPGAEAKVYTAGVICRSLETGRSRVPAGTLTDTAQRERARIAGVASDSFCAFVARNARRTLTIEGD